MPSALAIAIVVAQATSTAMPPTPPITTIPTLPRSQKSDGVQMSEREIAQNKALFKFQQMRIEADPDARLLALLGKKQILEDSLPAIAHRQPFDAVALKLAYSSLAHVIGEMNVRNAELVIEQLATLSPEDRALVFERIPYLAAPGRQAPPLPPSK